MGIIEYLLNKIMPEEKTSFIHAIEIISDKDAMASRKAWGEGSVKYYVYDQMVWIPVGIISNEAGEILFQDENGNVEKYSPTLDDLQAEDWYMI